MSKKGITAVLSTLILGLYIVIIAHVFFSVLHVDVLANFGSAMLFEVIGFLLLLFFVIGNIISKSIGVGFFVPLVLATAAYTIALNVVNMACITIMAHSMFVLIHLIILFVYCLISIPMYIMSKR